MHYHFVSLQGQRGETAVATMTGPSGNPGAKGVTGIRGEPGFSGQRELSASD